MIGEAAVYLALANGMRAFYTTPLKALSNQKYHDFKKQFGEERVGLLTGDVSANREADVVVMTTEIYRNMLYAAESGMEVSGTKPSVIDDVYAVIFDEFHFMNDRERGTVRRQHKIKNTRHNNNTRNLSATPSPPPSDLEKRNPSLNCLPLIPPHKTLVSIVSKVWEESVIISPKRTLLVALSATMRNVQDVREWFTAVHGPTELVISTHRPVPLEFMFCNRTGIYTLFSNRKGYNGYVLASRPKSKEVELVEGTEQGLGCCFCVGDGFSFVSVCGCGARSFWGFFWGGLLAS